MVGYWLDVQVVLKVYYYFVNIFEYQVDVSRYWFILGNFFFFLFEIEQDSVVMVY